MLNKVRLPLLLLVVLLGLDFLSKQIALSQLSLYETVRVMPGLNLFLAFNHGMAFSFLSDGHAWQRWFLSAISWIAGALFVYWLVGEKQASSRERWTLVFLGAGALGNGIDRLAYGYVIDFIDLYYQASHFATFNFADIYINIGVGLLIVNYFKKGERNACRFS